MPIVIFSIGSKILKKRNIEKIEVSARGEALCYCNVFYVESGKSINKYFRLFENELSTERSGNFKHSLVVFKQFWIPLFLKILRFCQILQT